MKSIYVARVSDPSQVDAGNSLPAQIVKEYDLPMVKWAFSKLLNWEREKTKLEKEEQKLAKRLTEIRNELN